MKNTEHFKKQNQEEIKLKYQKKLHLKSLLDDLCNIARVNALEMILPEDDCKFMESPRKENRRCYIGSAAVLTRKQKNVKNR